MHPTIQDLAVQSLLAGLTETEMGKLLPLVSLIRIAKDEHVFKEKAACRGIYMIREGRIEISKTTPDGWKQPLVILGQGRFMGEIATLEKTGHATDARALEGADLVLFPKEAFDSLERTEPSIMLKVIKNIAIVSALNVRRMNNKFIKVLVNY